LQCKRPSPTTRDRCFLWQRETVEVTIKRTRRLDTRSAWYRTSLTGRIAGQISNILILFPIAVTLQAYGTLQHCYMLSYQLTRRIQLKDTNKGRACGIASRSPAPISNMDVRVLARSGRRRTIMVLPRCQYAHRQEHHRRLANGRGEIQLERLLTLAQAHFALVWLARRALHRFHQFC